MVSKDEIKLALKYIDKNWEMQNNDFDAKTKYIYRCKTVDEVKANSAGNNDIQNYALHRWYNFNCAKLHEDMFIAFGAMKEDDEYHKTIDFYLFDTSFDLKTTYFPKKIADKENYDLKKRIGKNKLIFWLYENQSKQGRFHLENRLFIICEDLKSKSNFSLIEEKIKNFIDFSKQNGFNKISLNDKIICSDIILISNTL